MPAGRSRLLNLFVLVVSSMNIINLVCRSHVGSVRHEGGPWFFSFRLGPVVPGCPALRSTLLRPETTLAETIAFLRLAGPGQGPRELS